MSRQRRPLQPPVRVAPPAELNAYVVYEHELDLLAQGSPASLMLNFALFFLGSSVTAFATLLTLPKESERAYYTFLIIAVVSAIAGVVLLTLWWFFHTSTRHMVRRIKAQMPLNPPTDGSLEQG